MTRLGRPIFPNMIYDPTTRHALPDGRIVVTDPFPGNIIPAGPARPGRPEGAESHSESNASPTLLVNNFQGGYNQERVTQVPSFKVDQVVNSKNKFSFLMNRTSTQVRFLRGRGRVCRCLFPPRSALTFARTRALELGYDADPHGAAALGHRLHAELAGTSGVGR